MKVAAGMLIEYKKVIIGRMNLLIDLVAIEMFG
jgi:hypothetical protein